MSLKDCTRIGCSIKDGKTESGTASNPSICLPIDNIQSLTGKKVNIFSNGCIENQIDHTKLQTYFEHNGWQNVEDYRNADLIIFNTCGFDKNMEDASIKKINELQSNTKALVIVGGCLPKINPSRLAAVFKGVSFGPRTMNHLDKIINARIPIDQVRVNHVTRTTERGNWMKLFVEKIIETISIADRYLPFSFLSIFRKFVLTWFDTRMFYLNLGVGCLSNCSFCAIKHAKGTLKSTSPEEIIAQFREGLKQGYGEFVLSSEDCGSYGLDIGTNLIELLTQLLNIEGIYKLHIRYVEPSQLINYCNDLIGLLKTTDKIVSLCSSIQSGNNRVLRTMNRDVRIEDWIQCVQALKLVAPDLSIRTQIIVGFPGETEEEFQDTLRLFDLLNIDSAGIYAYSDRPFTEANRMPDKISEDIKRRRRNQAILKFIVCRIRHSMSRLRNEVKKKIGIPA